MRDLIKAVAPALLIAILPAAVHGQDVRVWERNVDSAASAYRAAQLALTNHEDSVRAADASMTLISVGAFRLLVTPNTEAVAREAAARVDRALRPQMGAAVDRLAKFRFGIRGMRPDERRFGQDSSSVVVTEWAAEPDAPDWRIVRFGSAAGDVTGVTDALLNHALWRLESEAGREFTEWLGSARLTIEAPTDWEWSRQRATLATAEATVAHRCGEGVRSDCEAVLGLRSTPDPVTSWFGPEERRAVVRRLYADDGPFEQQRRQECLEGRQDAVCIALIRNVWSESLIPGKYSLRLGLVQEAMALGGPRAFERLVAAKGSLSERLSAAAGVSSDSLVGAWMSRVRSASSLADRMSPLTAGTSLIWILACAGLAARSSRWR